MKKRNLDRRKRLTEEKDQLKLRKKRNKQQIRIQNWLKDKRNALVAITRRNEDQSLSRSMGFVIDHLETGHEVICTAKHVFGKEKNLESYHIHQGINGELELAMHHPSPLNAPTDLDISFLISSVRNEKSLLLDASHYGKWTAPSISQENTQSFLFNTKNIIGTSRSAIFDVMRQAQKPYPHGLKLWSKYENRVVELRADDYEGLPKLKEEGYLEYGLLQMFSTPGCSGSPIWDEDLRLIGMNTRGNDLSNKKDNGDLLAYVYNQDLQDTYQSLLPQIKDICSLDSKR